MSYAALCVAAESRVAAIPYVVAEFVAACVQGVSRYVVLVLCVARYLMLL